MTVFEKKILLSADDFYSEDKQFKTAGKHLILGFSGGADSMSLAHYLAVHRANEDFTLSAVHVNHLLRGDESERDQQMAEAFCKKMDIPLTIIRVDVAAMAKESGESVEVCGRNARYTAFMAEAEKYRQQGAFPVIVTAHTLSDDTETILMHLIRGTALNGLCGIPVLRTLPDGTQLFRPMLRLTREEVEDYCQKNGLAYAADSTNNSDLYTRNKIRNQLLPIMKEMNPSLEETFLRMRTALEADHAYLEQQTEALMCEAASDDGIDLEVLAAADPALRHRAEEKLLKQKQLSVSRKNILLLDTVVQGLSSGTEIGEYRFVRRGGSLVFDALSCYRADPVILPDDGGKAEVKIEKIDSKGNKAEYRKIDIYFTVTDYIDYDRLRKVYKNLLYFAVDYDTIKNDAVIRTRMPGDKIFLPGRNGHKTLKKLFQEHHLSKEKRESSLMLAEGREVIWLEGFGVGADYLPTDKTKRVLIAWKERMASL